METSITVPTVNTAEIGQKGREWFRQYNEKLKDTYYGRVIVIEVESGDYFLGDTLDEANTKARQKYPEAVFFAGRIGYRALISFRAPGGKPVSLAVQVVHENLWKRVLLK